MEVSFLSRLLEEKEFCLNADFQPTQSSFHLRKMFTMASTTSIEIIIEITRLHRINIDLLNFQNQKDKLNQ